MTKSTLQSFDLSVFDIPSIPLNQICTVIAVELSKVIEDPHQPRKVFNQEDLEKFAQEIAVRGVMSPIQVKNANRAGQYQIIQGARRYRASLLAGLKTIPAIVRTDEALFDDYSQVTENTQRENLSPLDIARFIAKRKEQGESNVQIAEKLSESKDYVGKHLALLDAPDFIQEALLTGVITGVESAYHLFSIYKKDSKVALALLEGSNGLTQSEIRATLKSFNQPIVTAESNLEAVNTISPHSAELRGLGKPEDSGESNALPLATVITADFGAQSIKSDAGLKSNSEPARSNQAPKFDKKLAKSFVQNLSLQLRNKAAGQIVFNHSDAQVLKSLLEGLL